MNQPLHPRQGARVMFCEACRAAKGWPGMQTSAYGPCSSCGVYDNLYIARKTDLVPFEPGVAHYEALARIRHRIAARGLAGQDSSCTVVDVPDLRVACWLRNELADMHVHVRHIGL